MAYLRAAVPAIRSGGFMVLEAGIILLGLASASIGVKTGLDLLFT